MAIQTYGDLQSAVADYANRQDLANQIPDFINKVHIELQEIVGPLTPLVNASDTNALLSYDPYVYLHGALVQAAQYLKDTDLLNLYEPKYEGRKQTMMMTGYDIIEPQPNSQIPVGSYNNWWFYRRWPGGPCQG
jgi:hypothetical protein